MVKKEQELINELLEAWEGTYKKGQLTLWVFLSLRDGEKYVEEIQLFVAKKSLETITCEEQSLYRLLRKFRELQLVEFTTKPGSGGPERKYYFLTKTGKELLQRFAERNISLFYRPEIQALLFNNN